MIKSKKLLQKLLQRASNCLLPSVISIELRGQARDRLRERRNLILPETDSSVPLRSIRNDLKSITYLVTLVAKVSWTIWALSYH